MLTGPLNRDAVAGPSTQTLCILVNKMPECPKCKGRLNIIHGLQHMNPWKYKCPLCGTILEDTLVSKLLLIPFALYGLTVVSIAIYQEETGKWVTSDSLEFFAYAFIVSVVLAICAWPFTRFTVKEDA